ncbi:class I SAM-dependent rRNA methyltransferase [soil metagenome]
MPRPAPARSPRAPRSDPPERSLEPGPDLPTVAVRSPGHHPLIFKKMVIGPKGGPRPRDGDLVKVIDRDGVPLGFGLWNSQSQVALRLLSPGTEPPGPDFWFSRIDEAVALRREVLRLDEVTEAYRLLHAEGDGLSGLIVDRFGDVLSAEAFSLGIYQRIGPLLERLKQKTGATRHLVRVDERIAQAEGFPGRPLASPDLPARVTITEQEVRFRVHFVGGHKTGFFCDQRDNRLEFARYCQGRSVLDVCCYTGGFALYALVNGEAEDVTGVDLDEKAVALARENANLNQVRPTLVHADAFGYMRQMALNGRSYGALVLDPPKLIPSRTEAELGKRKYLDLNTLAMNLVEPGGLFLTCSCSGLLSAEEFLAILRISARRAGRSARILAVTGASPDHPVGLEALEGSYLKAVWLLLGDRRPPGEPSPCHQNSTTARQRAQK